MIFYIETYGCQMNIAESAALALAAGEKGWEKAESADCADLVIINTCSVRATAEQRVMGRLAHYKALKKKRPAWQPALSILVAGCMAERLGDKLKKEGADFILGTSERSRFPSILDALENKLPDSSQAAESASAGEKPAFSFSPFHLDEKNPFRSFLPIMHGCNNFCSYCIVPYVRGREISRSPASILEEIRLLGERGVREITLLGQNVNSYKWGVGNGEWGMGQRTEGSREWGIGNGELNFAELLKLIAKTLAGAENAGGVRWVRFLAPHPKDFSDESIRVLAENPCFCRHIHLPVQHGSNRILAAMNRRYTREEYLNLAGRLRSAMPDLSLSTDILVGFPGETDDDLEAALSLMEEVKFLYAYMYHYNPREGTAAYDLPGRINEEVKKKRLSRVIALQKRHTAELLKSRLGAEQIVLFEGISKKNADELVGRTERDEMVVVPGKALSVGSFGKLKLSSLRGNTYRSHDFEPCWSNV